MMACVTKNHTNQNGKNFARWCQELIEGMRVNVANAVYEGKTFYVL